MFVKLIVLAFATSTAFGATLSERVERASQSLGLKKGNFGIWVHDDTDDKEVVSLRGHERMIPASLSKIMTAAAALDAYPPEITFTTQALAMGSVQNGKLLGALYIRGGGDPSLVSERLWTLSERLYQSGLRRVEGDLIIDDSLFDDIRYDADRDSVRVDRAYDAPIGALSFNWNSVNVYARPGAKAGTPATVFADPESNYIKLTSKVKTSSKSAEKSLSASREKAEGGDRVTAMGAVGVGVDEAVVYKSISVPDLWAGENISAFLKRRGITVTGKVKSGRAPSEAKELAAIEGASMGEIVTSMMKFSNNYVAEMLTKQMAIKSGATPATMKAGIKHIHEFLSRVGLKESEYTFVNASGLTLENRMSPAQIGQVLLHVKQDATIFPEFMTSLPIAGVDGTLKSRMRGQNTDGRIRAKTGLLRQGGVAALGGYASLARGSVRTFVVLYNVPSEIPDLDKVWRSMDRIAVELLEE